MRKLTKDEVRHIWVEATCPFCGGALYNGPQGGLLTHILCGNDLCGARFSMGPINVPGFDELPYPGFDELTHDSKLAPEKRIKISPMRTEIKEATLYPRHWWHRLKRLIWRS